VSFYEEKERLAGFDPEGVLGQLDRDFCHACAAGLTPSGIASLAEAIDRLLDLEGGDFRRTAKQRGRDIAEKARQQLATLTKGGLSETELMLALAMAEMLEGALPDQDPALSRALRPRVVAAQWQRLSEDQRRHLRQNGQG
jgi:hypothetical protein